MKHLIMFLSLVLLALGLTSPALAAPPDMPAASVTDNSRADTLGIFADTSNGAAECYKRLDADTVRFYQPTDLRGYKADAQTRPLEKSDCWRMRVRGGVIGIVALREGALVNIGMRNGRMQPVAYNACNNWLEALPTQVSAVKQAEVVDTPKPKLVVIPPAEVTVNTSPTTTEREVVDTVIIKRRIIVKYVDEVIYENPPALDIEVPETNIRYVNRPKQTKIKKECVCYRPPNDTQVLLYRYRYPDGNDYCVPKYMGDKTKYPPGYGPNR